ncbi:hypothetical protein LUZ60_017597 [Juncus effusus]|nr:hypothetical protein LUZ60_017597 [Juncus effusus]
MQGRTDPNQNTGLSIHKFRIIGSSDLGSTPSYLGRGNFALSTLYYGEYGNTGPGSDISGRVQWDGVHASMSKDEASKFTVGNFIFGDSWLPGTGVSYTSGL